jgi:8-oxo-dGTP pyrophosphatase MutT (NUDIX family)
MVKTVIAGIVVTDGRYVLLGHVTGKGVRGGYDIFKGNRQNSKEKYIDTALREMKEETGVELKADDLEYKGKFDYQDDKKLILYSYRSRNVKKEFERDTLYCSSFTEEGLPEMDNYKIVAFHILHLYLPRELRDIVFKIVHDTAKGISWG